MTAEIGILNKQGVALAADSAVTFTSGNQMKVLNTANKLFNLSSYEPVGIMMYSNGDYMGTPWEIIIKQYRKFLNKTKFKTLKEYGQNFFEYVFSNKKINNVLDQEFLVQRLFNERLNEILNIVNDEIMNTFDNIKPSENDVKRILQKEIDVYIQEFEKRNDLENPNLFTLEDYTHEYFDSINPIITQFINIQLDSEYIDKLIYVGYLSVVKDFFSSYTSIVIAGYGDDEIFPSICEYYVCGSTIKFNKYKLNNEQIINCGPIDAASIIPFAQQEMVHSIVTGVDPDLYNKITGITQAVTLNLYDLIKNISDVNNLNLNLQGTKAVFDEAGIQIDKEIHDYIDKVQKENYINPILTFVLLIGFHKLLHQ